MSVQYRGADTPFEKAEFSHQDCAIMLTIVAYYDHGLNRKQLCDTFAVLDKKGKNAKAVIYDEWVKLSKLQMIDLDSEAVNSINKIDLANNAQFEVLFKYFNKSIGTINLWLNSCVFPYEVDMPTLGTSHITHQTIKDVWISTAPTTIIKSCLYISSSIYLGIQTTKYGVICYLKTEECLM